MSLQLSHMLTSLLINSNTIITLECKDDRISMDYHFKLMYRRVNSLTLNIIGHRIKNGAFIIPSACDTPVLFSGSDLRQVLLQYNNPRKLSGKVKQFHKLLENAILANHFEVLTNVKLESKGKDIFNHLRVCDSYEEVYLLQIKGKIHPALRCERGYVYLEHGNFCLAN